jgi:hypothetical protein
MSRVVESLRDELRLSMASAYPPFYIQLEEVPCRYIEKMCSCDALLPLGKASKVKSPKMFPDRIIIMKGPLQGNQTHKLTVSSVVARDSDASNQLFYKSPPGSLQGIQSVEYRSSMYLLYSFWLVESRVS